MDHNDFKVADQMEACSPYKSNWLLSSMAHAAGVETAISCAIGAGLFDAGVLHIKLTRVGSVAQILPVFMAQLRGADDLCTARMYANMSTPQTRLNEQGWKLRCI